MSPRALHLALIRAAAALALVAVPVYAQISETSLTLTWTAPGDDSLTGQATRYDLRWSLTPIANLTDFARATPLAGVPTPRVAGSTETFTVTGLTPSTTYWFALRTLDESGNISDLSNIVSGSTLASSDVMRPAPIVLTTVGVTNSSVTVSWTDSGDDSLTGNSATTEIRWANVAITDANWNTANVVSGVPSPGAPGTPHQITVGGLDRTVDLWFAARARDDVNHVSTVPTSLFVVHVLDTAPPATPGGLSGTVEPVRDVRLRWNANAEADLAGYHVYRALTQGGTMMRLTAAALTATEFLDTTTPDSLAVWYSLSAVDGAGNESARTAPYRVYLVGGGIAAWDLTTPYPNPSPVGGSVTLPLAVPAGGPYDATLEIQDSAGQRVRTMSVRGAAPGPLALVWDGLNDAGRATAPGVYRVWLRAGDTRKLTRILRVP